MKEYLEQRIAYIASLRGQTTLEIVVYESILSELTAALNHLNNIKEE